MSEYHFGVYIGRFQPLHVGHEHVIREALKQVDKLIVIVGSSFMARTPVNPFTFEERKAMIALSFGYEIQMGRLIVLPLYDYEHDIDWQKNLRKAVNDAILAEGNREVHNSNLHGLNDFKVALAGFGKDASSYYLKMFPEWGSIQLGTQHGTINASDIREEYFRTLPHLPMWAVSDNVLIWLKNWVFSDAFRDLVAYKNQINIDRSTFGTGPFLAADSLILHRGKILLITRGKAVGRGTLAMPGGFVEPDETFLQAAIRETWEETGLTMNDLNYFRKKFIIVDTPRRSLRGRIVSGAFRFDIPDDVEIPKVAGGDDAAHAGWYNFEELSTDRFYEDHHNVISNLLKD